MKKLITIILLVLSAGVFAQGRHYKVNNPVVISGQNNITIKGYLIVGGASNCIYLRDCSNVHITKCKLLDSKKVGILLENCKNVLIDSCYITNVQTGVNAKNSVTVKVNYNYFRNMNGPFPAGCAVQFNNVSAPASQINYNKVENIAGQAQHPQDLLSVYKSNGMPGDSIQVIGNWIRGGQVINDSGGAAGIVLGDVGGSYQVARYNVVINGGFVGMQVQGGSHIKMDHNTIYSSPTAYSNDGLSYGNYSGQPSTDVEISYNKIKFFNRNGKEADCWWDPKTVSKPIGWETNIQRADIDDKILPHKLHDEDDDDRDHGRDGDRH
ncbi:right-handed parallel beta-helix repeat-containing protein [Mucilaginibacter sp. BT774]|uniref:right-handed parallel beta-helix repeat-containing protein n=1 Tax=Mucilaginibacter sp. BT774 TaxID=3062276 RepID=UPI002676DA2D|nr:right-handed parallel beta-helix repeat-containing protein [Mucilaginibacter sp. BT774]MDO3624730.1 right-handed parallel beta-helix repeat-containing protein [Mucilaginibacter sp. BT774]